jgi:hypothetical protein
VVCAPCFKHVVLRPCNHSVSALIIRTSMICVPHAFHHLCSSALPCGDAATSCTSCLLATLSLINYFQTTCMMIRSSEQTNNCLHCLRVSHYGAETAFLLRNLSCYSWSIHKYHQDRPEELILVHHHLTVHAVP